MYLKKYRVTIKKRHILAFYNRFKFENRLKIDRFIPVSLEKNKSVIFILPFYAHIEISFKSTDTRDLKLLKHFLE